nr:MAG TPA: hypothetical protein [Caudoviricetes sp.]
MNTPAIETDVLCHVFELQAEIIRKQAIVIGSQISALITSV